MPDQGTEKQSYFPYNRKTQKEAEALFESKVKKCPYCLWEEVDLPQENCGMNGDKDIQLWKLVDFLSTRTFDMEQNKLPLGRRLFSAAGAEALIRAISEGTPHQWKDIREALEKAIKPLAFAKGEWNQSQIKQLQDIVAPQLKVRCGRAGISSAAARKLYELATASGSLFDPVQWEQWKKESGLYEYRAKIAGSDGGCYPQVERLLGRLRKSGGEPAFATEGLLQSLFRKYRDKLGGKLAPDYCIVECIKNPARNSEECNLFSKEKDKNERRKKEHIAQYGITNPSKSALLRVRLFEEQGGRFHQDDPQKNAPAICPFTGESLGCNPLDQTLELAHLYPDSKGGLYMAENLVLTRRETNQAMGNRTPVEAAALKLPGWMNWEGMLETTAAFHWGKAKRQLFAFTPSEEKSFPDFNNLTRTAQLARELRRMVAIWMGIHDKADAMRLRIGNPSGMYTAAARVSLLGKEYVKDRSNNIHHRKDAAVMTCIPPTGINDVRYGGIFYTAMEGGNRRLYCINDNDGLPLPKFKQLDKLDGAPVFKPLGSGKTRSLGDSTFWAADEEGKVHQHVPLTQASKLNDIMASLRLSDDKADRKAIPTKRIKEWLEQGNSKPLRMNDGTPVKRITKKDTTGTGNLQSSPLGWSTILTEAGKFSQLRILHPTNDRMEIWLGWDKKSRQWKYYKRVIPTRSSLIGIKRMGMPWRGRDGAPPFLVNLLDKKKKPDLKSLICGILPPHSVKVGVIRKGDVFLCRFKRKEKKDQQEQKSLLQLNEQKAIETWGYISAINSKGEIELQCLTHKDMKTASISKANDIATNWLKLPPAEEQAAQLNLVPLS